MRNAERAEHLPTPPIPDLAHPHCLFLDLDGTLADIAPEPHLAEIDAVTINTLSTLHRRLAGAVAVVTGRALADADRMLAPLLLPAVAVHGNVRRSVTGEVWQIAVPEERTQAVYAALAERIAGIDGLFVEIKTGAVALHWRRRPELADACLLIADEVVSQMGGGTIALQPGKMVIELKLSRETKGRGIAALMAEPPFAGRRPIFIGDDETDETGFAVVNAQGGLSIKVGPEPTAARYHLAGPEAVRAWLKALAAAVTMPGGAP
jgi:trehalose 6-phosphate phosphatase